MEFTDFTSGTDGSPQAVTYYYFSGQNAIQTRSATFSVGNCPAPESVPIQYEYVFSPLGAKTPLVRDTYVDGTISPDDRLYYLTDANTNVTAVVGLSGGTWQVAERYVYDPYGSVTVYTPGWTMVANGNSLSASTVGNTIGFASMSFDPATGLYNDEARWYSTSTSTFISRDPLGYAAGDMNIYRYCGGNPVIYVDPSGRQVVAPWNPDAQWWFGLPNPFSPDTQAAAKQAICDSIWAGAEAIFQFIQDHPDLYSGPALDAENVVADSLHTLAKGVVDVNPKTMGWFDLGYAWLYEVGPAKWNFGGEDRTTQDVKKLAGVNKLREMVRAGRKPPFDEEIHFGVQELATTLKTMDTALAFLGSYHVWVTPGTGNTVNFRVYNETGWESGTRYRRGRLGIIANRKRGDPGIHLGGMIYETWKWCEEK